MEETNVAVPDSSRLQDIDAAMLEQIKQAMLARGYRIEVDSDGTERLIRDDGSVAVIARPQGNTPR